MHAMPPPDSRNPPALQEEDVTVVRIFESLRASIVGGAVAPGQPINSVELAARFGTSRTPVREALLLLSQYGLVNLTARKRPRVAPVSVKTIRDLYALRSALHVYISEAIVRGATDNALHELRAQASALISQFEKSSTEEHLQGVEDYLAVEAALADNEVVLGVLDSLRWKIAWFRRLGSISREQLLVLAHDRLRVADAYLDRDARLAEAMNRSMLGKAATYCEKSFTRAISARGSDGPVGSE
jgi:DNA-binding GntR family transcriptional regulator